MSKWRDFLPQVVNSINHHQEKTYRSQIKLLEDFFTRPTETLPQTHPKLFKFQINQKVSIDATPQQRKKLGFKYSLNRGMGEIFCLTKEKIVCMCSTIKGKLQNEVDGIIQARKLLTKNNKILPVYSVFIPSLNQVNPLPSPH